MFGSRKDLQDYVRTKTGAEIPLDVADFLYRGYRQWTGGDDEDIDEWLKNKLADVGKVFEVPRELLRIAITSMHWPWEAGTPIPWGDNRDGKDTEELVSAGTVRSKIGSAMGYIQPVDKTAGVVSGFRPR